MSILDVAKKAIRKMVTITVAGGTLAAGTAAIPTAAVGHKILQHGKDDVAAARSEEADATSFLGRVEAGIGKAVAYGEEAAGVGLEAAGAAAGAAAVAGKVMLSEMKRRRLREEAQQNQERY